MITSFFHSTFLTTHYQTLSLSNTEHKKKATELDKFLNKKARTRSLATRLASLVEPGSALITSTFDDLPKANVFATYALRPLN